ncbi:MAG: hypothetical protein J1F64_00110 [Oscillospiraceae bacterium]|nr:hypothetical protein [Oscillospiraceae bacterium]
MKMLKKAVTAAVTFALAVSSVAAMACSNDSFLGYDQDNIYSSNYGKLYYCPESNTTYVDGYAGKVEWKHAYFEADYPFLEVVELYLDDKPTGKTQYAGLPDSETVLKPEFWEAKYPYQIYSRLYAGLSSANKATDWVVNSGETENVVGTFDYAGFDIYAWVNGAVKDVSFLYAEHAEKFGVVTDNPVNNFGVDGGMWALADAYYSAATYLGADGNYYFTDAFLSGDTMFKDFVDNSIDNYVRNINWLKLAGPDYYTGGTRYVDTVNDIINGKPCTWYDEILILAGNPVDYEWKTVGYEAEYPYRYYQILYVDGVPMDGASVELVGSWSFVEEDINKTYPSESEYIKTVTVDPVTNAQIYVDSAVQVPANGLIKQYKLNSVADRSHLPYIFRYTGGCASPKVEWKYAFTEAAYPHAIIEQLFLDGKATEYWRKSGENAASKPELEYNSNNPRYYKVNITSPYAEEILQKFVSSYYPLHDYNCIVAGDDYYIPFSVTQLYDGHTKYTWYSTQVDNVAKVVAEDLGVKSDDIEFLGAFYDYAVQQGMIYVQ